ncbi:MAG: glycosyltransferase family 4 protein [Thermoplasmata archaeon]
MTPRLRILVATPLPSTVTGGIEEYAYGVIAALRARGHEVTVITTRYGHAARDEGRSPSLTVLDSKEVLGRPLCYRPLAMVKILSLVRRSDVVHVHMPFPFVEAWVAGAAKLMGKPVVVTYHMDALVDEVDKGPVNVLHRLAAQVYRRSSAIPAVELADRVCTNTEAYARQSLVLRDRMDRVLVVHQGIDARKFEYGSRTKSEELRRRILGSEYRELVCFVGRLVPYKGLQVLLEGIRTLNRSQTLFVIGGRGTEEARLRRVIADHHLTNVRLIGYVPDDELVDLFGAADLVVAPSLSALESTPITLLYARAVGVPVVGTDVGGTAESIPNDGAAGLIVRAGDSRALAEAIGRLLDLDGARPPPAAPRFWSNVADEYDRVVGELWERRSGGAPAHPDMPPVSYPGSTKIGGGK